jgi:hypothetical protein
MQDDIRFRTAIAKAREIMERLESRPRASYPVRLGLITYLVLEAIRESEKRLAKRQSKIHVSIRDDRSAYLGN